MATNLAAMYPKQSMYGIFMYIYLDLVDFHSKCR